MMESIPKISLVDHESDEFVEFALEMKSTSAELEAAYEHLCGVREGEPADPKIRSLFEEMQRRSKRGFPINRFASLITNLRENENGVETYLAYINTLPLAEKEIRTLYSIVTKDREGELQFYLEGRPLMHFDIENTDERNDKAYLLKGALERVMERVPSGKKLSLLFMEK